ncbi:O-antigen ligase family protein [Vibrio lentus]
MLIKLEKLIVYFYFLFLMGFNASILVPVDRVGTVTGSNVLYSLSWFVIYTCIIFLFFKSKPKFNLKIYIIYSLVAFHFMSSAWSLQPSRSILYSVSFLNNIVFVHYLFSRFNLIQIVDMMLKSIITIVTLSLLFWIVDYQVVYYFDVHSRSNFLGTQPIRGFFNHKIPASVVASIAIIMSIFVEKLKIKYVTISIMLFFVLLTGSSSGVAVFCLGIGYYIYTGLCIKIGLPTPKYILTTCLIITILFLTYYKFGEDFLILLNRDPTLTGRTILWAWGVETGQENPIFGWGYFGYFGSILSGNVAETYVEFANYDVPHFHNSFIQMFVDSGGLYTLSFILMIIYVARKSYRLALEGNNIFKLISVLNAMIFFASFIMLTYLRYNDFITVMFFIYLYGVLNFKEVHKDEKFLS